MLHDIKPLVKGMGWPINHHNKLCCLDIIGEEFVGGERLALAAHCNIPITQCIEQTIVSDHPINGGCGISHILMESLKWCHVRLPDMHNTRKNVVNHEENKCRRGTRLFPVMQTTVGHSTKRFMSRHREKHLVLPH